MSATIDIQTAEERNEQFDYYLLLPGTDLPRSVALDLPSTICQPAVIGPGLEWDVARGPSRFAILRVDTETMEVAVARGRDAVHPNPAGEKTFSSATEIVYKRSGSFSDDIRTGRTTTVSSDTVFALDTLCFELTNDVGSQYTMSRPE